MFLKEHLPVYRGSNLIINVPAETKHGALVWNLHFIGMYNSNRFEWFTFNFIRARSSDNRQTVQTYLLTQW